MLAMPGLFYGISQTNTMCIISLATTLIGLLITCPRKGGIIPLPPAPSVCCAVLARSAIVRLPRPQQNRVGSRGYPSPQQCRQLWSTLSGISYTPSSTKAITFWSQIFSQKFCLLKKNPRRQKPYCSLPVHASSSVMTPPHSTLPHRRSPYPHQGMGMCRPTL